MIDGHLKRIAEVLILGSLSVSMLGCSRKSPVKQVQLLQSGHASASAFAFDPSNGFVWFITADKATLVKVEDSSQPLILGKGISKKDPLGILTDEKGSQK